MSKKEKKALHKYVNTSFLIFIVVAFYFGYSYSHRMHLIDTKSETVKQDDMIVTSATTQLQPRLNSGGFVDITHDINSKIKVNIVPINGEEVATISTPEGKFIVDIYTMRDYDLDLGLTPKNIGEYPQIICTSIGKFSTGGIIIEISQRLGSQTYANRIYIKDGKLVDYGFTEKIGVRDEVIYYDNVVMIANTLISADHDIVRVYDDSTDEMLFNYSSFNLANNIDVPSRHLMIEAVGRDFIAFSSRYYDYNKEYYVNFNDEGKTIKSVWDSIKVSGEELERLQYDEQVTRGQTLVFSEYDYVGNLIYEVKDIVNGTTNSRIVLPLKANLRATN